MVLQFVVFVGAYRNRTALCSGGNPQVHPDHAGRTWMATRSVPVRDPHAVIAGQVGHLATVSANGSLKEQAADYQSRGDQIILASRWTPRTDPVPRRDLSVE